MSRSTAPGSDLGGGLGEFVYHDQAYRADDAPVMFLPATSSSDELHAARKSRTELALAQNRAQDQARQKREAAAQRDRVEKTAQTRLGQES